MIFKKQLSRRVILKIGMAFLIAAAILPRLLSPATFSPDLVDGVQGVFYGLSIGFNLLWVSRTSRERRGEGC